MDVEFLAPGMHEVVDPDPPLERIAGGLSFGEGPVWDRRAGCLYFVDIIESRIHRWTPGKGLETVAEATGHANGMTFDRDGRLLVAGWSGRTVWRREADGGTTILASHYDGKKVNTPNDLVVRSDGSIYWTDSDGGLFIPAMDGEDIQKYLDFSGVYRIPPDGGAMELVVPDMPFPNGLAFSPDEKVLYVSDTWAKEIRAFDVRADGSLGKGRSFYKLVGPESGHADGVKVDQAGNVYSTGPGGLHVIAPDGTLLGRMRFTDEGTNLAWGGDDWRTLFITTFHTIYRTRVKIPGTPTW